MPIPTHVDQPDATPTAKVGAATAGGSLGVAITLLWNSFAPEGMPQFTPETAAALSTLMAGAFGYFKRERI